MTDAPDPALDFLVALRSELGVAVSLSTNLNDAFPDAVLRLRACYFIEDYTGNPYPPALLDSMLTVRDLYDMYLVKREHQ